MLDHAVGGLMDFNLLLLKLVQIIEQPYWDVQTQNSAIIFIKIPGEQINEDGWAKPCKYHIFVRVQQDGLYQYHIIGPGGNTLKSFINIDMGRDQFVQLIVKIHNNSEYDWSKQ